ncbi:MAG: TolB family protein, partial [Acidobacteriota bacterium]
EDPAGTPPIATAGRPRSRHAAIAWAATGAAIGALVAGLGSWMALPTPASPLRRFAEVLPPDRVFTGVGHPRVAISPDGSQVAYVANNRLFLRSLDRGEAGPVSGTEGATTPFFSPDGRFIGYFDFGDGELRRVAHTGGTPVVITKVTNVFGARWQADDTILYGAEDGVWRVPAGGGAPEVLVRIEPGERLHGAQLLPDGETLLFTFRPAAVVSRWEDAQVVAQSLATGRRTTIAAGSDARYVPTGHLVYANGSTLFAVPFDTSGVRQTATPVPVVENVGRAGTLPGSTATANYDISRDGVLVHVAGVEIPLVARQLVAVDRTGVAIPLVDERRDYWRPRVSPDGKRIAVEIRNERQGLDPWIVDLADGTLSPLPSQGIVNDFYAWTNDGQSLIFRSDRREDGGIYRQPADGSGDAQLLFAATETVIPGAVSRDGVLVFASGEQTGRREIQTMKLDEPKAVEYLATPAMEHMPMFSPDGRWIAYVSNETGRQEVYIRPYPLREGLLRRVSDGGATAPVWAPDGSELFYRNAAGMLVAVPVRLGSSITVGRPRELFRVAGRFRTSGNAAAYDIEPSGRRFIMVTEEENPRPTTQQIHIALNWLDELKARVPVR